MNLNQYEKKQRYMKNKRIFNEAKQEAIADMHKVISQGLASQMELVMLLVLHDKFGFGAERCSKALAGFEELWGDINDKRLSLEDIEEVVKAELNITFEDDGIYSVDKKGNKKKIQSVKTEVQEG